MFTAEGRSSICIYPWGQQQPVYDSTVLIVVRAKIESNERIAGLFDVDAFMRYPHRYQPIEEKEG